MSVLSRAEDVLLVPVDQTESVKPPAQSDTGPAAETILLDTAVFDARGLVLEVLPLPEFEKLTYNMRWTVFNVGTLTAEIKGFRLYKGRLVYVFQLHLRSNEWLSKIYAINSVFTSYMDAERMQTLREEVDRKEGSYRKHAVVEYDQDNHQAYFHSYTDNTSKSFPIPPGVQDALSSVYYFRTLPLTVGGEVQYKIVAGETVYDFSADLLKQKKISSGPFKSQEAILVRPYATLNGKAAREGSMIGYFSTITTKIPLAATIKTPLFTSASAFLVDVEYPEDRQ